MWFILMCVLNFVLGDTDRNFVFFVQPVPILPPCQRRIQVGLASTVTLLKYEESDPFAEGEPFYVLVKGVPANKDEKYSGRREKERPC